MSTSAFSKIDGVRVIDTIDDKFNRHIDTIDDKFNRHREEFLTHTDKTFRRCRRDSNKYTDKVFKRYANDVGPRLKRINEKLDSVFNNTDDRFIETIKCEIRRVSTFKWEGYVNNKSIGFFTFRFTCRNAIKRRVKNMKLNRILSYDTNGGIRGESFYL